MPETVLQKYLKCEIAGCVERAVSVLEVDMASHIVYRGRCATHAVVEAPVDQARWMIMGR